MLQLINQSFYKSTASASQSRRTAWPAYAGCAKRRVCAERRGSVRLQPLPPSLPNLPACHRRQLPFKRCGAALQACTVRRGACRRVSCTKRVRRRCDALPRAGACMRPRTGHPCILTQVVKRPRLPACSACGVAYERGFAQGGRGTLATPRASCLPRGGLPGESFVSQACGGRWGGCRAPCLRRACPARRATGRWTARRAWASSSWSTRWLAWSAALWAKASPTGS